MMRVSRASRQWRRGAALAALLLAGCDLPAGLGPSILPSDSQQPRSNVDPDEQTRALPGFLNKSLVAPAFLKIGLAVAQAEISFQVTHAAQAGSVTLQTGRTYRVRNDGAKVVLFDGNTELLRVGSPLAVRTAAAGSLQYGPRRYRGGFDFIASPDESNKVTLINTVAPEDYLYGVLPAEMATGWPIEALKVQAVAARTYALANLGRRAKLGFDLFDTTADQVYKGFSIEQADTNSAVDGTHGQILAFNDQPIAAFFFASSGGETDDCLAVWGDDLPYIRGVKDIDDSPHASWTSVQSDSAVSQILKAMGQSVGQLQKLEVTTWTPHGRARWLKATGSGGEATVDANTLRLKLGLKSTRYKLSRDSAGWKFVGGGWGHGLGMSQWGARAYAIQGESYRDILARYYQQTNLVLPTL